MPRFYPLEITQVHRTIRDAVAVTLRPQAGDFSFIQGQYLTFRHDFDGVELRRSYSICAGLDDGCLQVGIKRVQGGAFSNWANDSFTPGMVLEAMPPMGQFHTALSPEARKRYIGFAGGSGITPILSIIRSILSREPLSQFTLVYANRAVSSIMFREELEDLKNLHMGRLTLLHVLEDDGQDIELFKGRIDAAKCDALFAGWIDVTAMDTAFICGPEPMMLEIAAALRRHGLSDEQIKYELFAAGQPGQVAKATTQATSQAVPDTRATVILDGTARSFDASRDQSVLQAALAHDIDAPFACTAGVCSTCKCKVLEGEVDMRANHALEDYEVAQGFVLSCQSYPLTDRLVVDYDH